MDEDKETEHPASSLAQRFLVNQLSISNQLVNQLLLSVQNALVEKIPSEKTKIADVLQTFQYPFNSCTSLVNKSKKTIKLPITVQIRANGQEHKEGIYAVSVTENVGVQVLEECCRKIVLIPDEIRLVEARKFEQELNCFCTIPKFSLQTELIEAGTKYELVFEKQQMPRPIKPASINQKSVHKSALHLDLHANGTNYQNDYLNESVQSTELSPSFDTSSNIVAEHALLSKLFSRDNNGEFSNALPDSDLTSSMSSSNWENKDVNSARLLPEFDPLDIFNQEPRARSIFDYLKHHKMDRASKVRINFVQILGKYYLEEIKPKLEGPSTAALRRAFIDKVFTCLEKVFTKPLPSQELFSNRMGKGFFDIYLKHQHTKTQRQTSQPPRQRSTEDEIERKLIDQIDRFSRANASSSPSQVSIKSENCE